MCIVLSMVEVVKTHMQVITSCGSNNTLVRRLGFRVRVIYKE